MSSWAAQQEQGGRALTPVAQLGTNEDDETLPVVRHNLPLASPSSHQDQPIEDGLPGEQTAK